MLLIRTLVTTIRTIFQRNDSCYVCAPTGSAAYQAGGRTIHSLFGINIKNIQDSVGPSLKNRLEQQFSNIVALIVDERSMLCSELFSTMEMYSKEVFHGGRNSNHIWAKLPILILVGDDYQLPPIKVGAFDATADLSEKEARLEKRNEKTSQRIANGEALFRQAGSDVMHLHSSKRVQKSQHIFRSLLKGVRSADSDRLTEDQVTLLCNYHLMAPHFSDEDRQRLCKDALFLFANRAPRDTFNRIKLQQTHSQENPVARIRAKTVKRGIQVSNNSHYDDSTPPCTNLCRGARVSITGCNIHPAWGLYNGSIGTVLDIVFKPGESPNTGNLPLYVLVHLQDYTGPTFLPGKPYAVPIVPVDVLCNNNCCCTRKFIPLTLAFGKTVHTFQGQNAGPVDDDKPPNAVQRIICDPGTRAFEGINIGLFYTILSRATTIREYIYIPQLCNLLCW